MPQTCLCYGCHRNPVAIVVEVRGKFLAHLSLVSAYNFRVVFFFFCSRLLTIELNRRASPIVCQSLYVPLILVYFEQSILLLPPFVCGMVCLFHCIAHPLIQILVPHFLLRLSLLRLILLSASLQFSQFFLVLLNQKHVEFLLKSHIIYQRLLHCNKRFFHWGKFRIC